MHAEKTVCPCCSKWCMASFCSYFSTLLLRIIKEFTLPAFFSAAILRCRPIKQWLWLRCEVNVVRMKVKPEIYLNNPFFWILILFIDIIFWFSTERMYNAHSLFLPMYSSRQRICLICLRRQFPKLQHFVFIWMNLTFYWQLP